jgi:hypothetical protein
MSKFKYKVINARMGKKVGEVVEYDHEPCAEFLACLEKVEVEKPKKLEVATPEAPTTQTTRRKPRGG